MTTTPESEPMTDAELVQHVKAAVRAGLADMGLTAPPAWSEPVELIEQTAPVPRNRQLALDLAVQLATARIRAKVESRTTTTEAITAQATKFHQWLEAGDD